MATNYAKPGASVDFVNSGSAITSGSVVVMGNIIGVALVDIANGATGAVAIEGVFTVPKVSAAVITQGQSVIYDVSASAFDDNLATPATGDVSGCCVAMESKGAATTSIDVKLSVGVGTVA